VSNLAIYEQLSEIFALQLPNGFAEPAYELSWPVAGSLNALFFSLSGVVDVVLVTVLFRDCERLGDI
jgi:hypothetical protein